MWEKVQKEKERRVKLKNNIKGDRGKYSSKYPFSGKIICGDCGDTFRRRTWNSNNSSKKVVRQCKTYIKDGKDACDMKAVDDKVLKDSFVEVFNELKIDKGGFTKTLSDNIDKVIKSSGQHKEIEKLETEIDEKKNQLKNLVKLQTTGKLDDEIYNEEYTRISEELNKLRDTKGEFQQDKDRKEQLKRRVNEVIYIINNREELLEQFDKEIFNALVEKIEILKPTHFVFVLKSGMKIRKKL
ncbi:recombinase zinc beta ribbon domain-containing protein [Wukongibacter sp. M2B1]|uniref:recombinase zinc beta ribbon domain-containing protein n=1 Tax=Wukongibacter sp. M2B1 TaxID=3088895 RepID=UPI003D7A9901